MTVDVFSIQGDGGLPSRGAPRQGKGVHSKQSSRDIIGTSYKMYILLYYDFL